MPLNGKKPDNQEGRARFASPSVRVRVCYDTQSAERTAPSPSTYASLRRDKQSSPPSHGERRKWHTGGPRLPSTPRTQERAESRIEEKKAAPIDREPTPSPQSSPLWFKGRGEKKIA